MTICIAAICNNGKAVVVASDRMITAGFLALEFEHPDSKIEELTKSCVGLTAGDALVSTELFRACRGSIQQFLSPSVELIADTVKEQFAKLRRQRAEDMLLKPRGLTLEEFYQRGLIERLPTELAVRLDHSRQEADYGVDIIIAGVDGTGAHIYGVENPGIIKCYDSLGYTAIGSGMSHALLTIVGSEHSQTKGINDTVYLVYEAKKKSELASGVGQAIELGIISTNEIKLLSDGEKQLLQGIYTKKTTPQLEQIEAAISELPFEAGR